MLVFVPLTEADLATLLAGGSLSAPPAYAVTPALLDALDYGPEMMEDAEYAALLFASVASLTRGHRRLVAVADVAAQGDDPLGAVEVPELAAARVTAFFTDEPAAAEAVRAAADAAAGRTLEDAWELPAVAALVSEHDLLWFGAEEGADLVLKEG